MTAAKIDGAADAGATSSPTRRSRRGWALAGDPQPDRLPGPPQVPVSVQAAATRSIS